MVDYTLDRINSLLLTIYQDQLPDKLPFFEAIDHVPTVAYIAEPKGKATNRVTFWSTIYMYIQYSVMIKVPHVHAR